MSLCIAICLSYHSHSEWYLDKEKVDTMVVFHVSTFILHIHSDDKSKKHPTTKIYVVTDP